MEFDLFISHASEDKEEIVRPLAQLLREHGLRVWLDETELKIGDSLRRSIDNGLAKSRYGLVVLSPDFLRKEWPQKELDGLVAREDGREKVILPVWHKLNRSDIVKFSPPLADKLSVPTSSGLTHVAGEILKVFQKNNNETISKSPSKLVSQSHDIHDLIVKAMDNVVSLSDAGSPRVVGIPTGFNDLDLFTSGFQSGSLVIVAGSSNSGKTIFAINIAKHVACTEGLPVLIFAPNESATQITNRFLGLISKIAQYKFRNAAFTNADWLVYVEAIERLRNATIAIDDTSRLTFEKIEIECRNRLHLHGALGLVIIDSVQHIDSSNNEPNDSIGIYRKIKSLARELNNHQLKLVGLN